MLPDRIPLEVLRSFVTFVDAPNIVKAAEKLRISQPLLSKHLRILQEALPQPVFFFEGRKKQPTRYGRALYEMVKGGLIALDNGLNDLNNQFADPLGARIRIGGREELLAELAPRLKFKGRIDFVPLSGESVAGALTAKKIEIGVTQHRIDSDVLVRKPFHRDRFQIVYPRALGLRENALSRALVSELLEHPYLSYGESDPGHRLAENYKLRTTLKIARTFASWPKIMEMCELGLGWSLVPALYSNKAGRNLQVIPIPDSILTVTEFHLFYPRDLGKLDWFRELIGECRI